MKVTQVNVELTRSTGVKFEFDKIGIVAAVEETEEPSYVITVLKKTILANMTGEGHIIGENVQTGTHIAIVTDDKKPGTKVEVEKKPKAKKGEPPVSEEKAPVVAEVEAVVAEAPVVVETKKAKPSKNTPYDRTLDTHKKLLKGFLDVAKKGWNDAANLPKAGKASTTLVGTDFLDAEGEILESFKTAFLAYL